MVGLVGCDGNVGSAVGFSRNSFLPVGCSRLRLERQEHPIKPKPEPAARVQIGQAKQVEEFVRTTAEHLAFTAEFLHLDLEHHAGVVVEATSDRQIHRHGRGCRRKCSQRSERHFEFIEGFQRNTVHAGEEFTSRPEGFHAAVQRGQCSEGLGIGWIEAVGGEQFGQAGVVAFVEQAHGAGDGRLTGGLVNHLAREPETGQGVLEHANVADTNLPAFETGSVEHVDRQSQHLRLGQRSGSTDEFHTVLEEFTVATGLEFLVAVALTVIRQAKRFGVHPHLLGDHPHDGCREFGAQRQVALALVLERIELVDDARAGLGGEQLERFKHRRLDPRETVALRHIFKQVLQRQPSLHRRRREVPSSAWSLHHQALRAVQSSRPLRLQQESRNRFGVTLLPKQPRPKGPRPL